MGRGARLSIARHMRSAWLAVVLLSLVISALQPGILLGRAVAQDGGTPQPVVPQSDIATQEPVVVTPATAPVAFRVVDANDQLIDDGYRLCVDGVTCVDILEGRASIDGLAEGTHTYEVVWKWDGDGPFQRKLDTFWVDPSIGENAVRIELTATPAFEPAVEPSATDAPATLPTIDVPATTATATATDVSTETATLAATATDTVAVSPSVTIGTATETATATASVPLTQTVAPTQTRTPTRTLTPTITPTLAPVSGKVTGTGGAGVNCRTQPSTSSAVIVVLREGQTAAYRGPAANGWQPVTCAGRAGYISTTYLTGIPVTPTATPRVTATTTTTATATPTRTVTVTGTISPTITGTVSPSVTTTRTVTTTATASPTGTPIAGGKVTGTGGDGVNCRRTPSTSGVIIATVPEGTVLPYRGPAANGWQPVTCSGQAGYISTAYLTGTTITPTPVRTPSATPTSPPTPAPGSSGVVTGTGGGGLNCRVQPSTSAAVITIIPEGSIVQFRGPASNGWQPVTCAGQAGYISASYLTGISSASGELWVDVNLSTQYMIVYRGSTRVLGTYVSTGRPGFDTPTGTYFVNTKLRSQTMSGVLGGEYYNVPDVPWVMYFTDRGHAIHGAYWHNNFGHVMSHGCINLPLDVAAWLYAQAPIGMRVVIHY